MGSRELLAVGPGAQSRFLLGILLETLGAIALVAWTIALAAGIVAVVEHHTITGALIALMALLGVRVIARIMAARLLASASARTRAGIRARVVTTMWSGLGGPAGSTGEDSTMLGPGIDSLDEYLTRFLPARLLAVIVPVVVAAIIAVLDPWTLLILLFAGPMLILLLAVIGSRTRELADRRFAELGWLRSFHLDMVRGIPTLKVFGRATESVRTIEEVSERFGRTTMSVLRTAFQTSLVIEWAATAATALVAVQVSFRMIDGDLGYGAALTVLMLTPEFFAPLRNLAVEYHAGQAGQAALDRLGNTESQEERNTTVTARSTPPRSGVIRLESVSFAHPETEAMILDEASLTIAPGEHVAVIGPSGIGKSTIVDLLLGLAQPTTGRITIDGRPLTNVDLDEWRHSVTSVPQDPFLFRTSVRDNVTLGAPHATDDEVHAALQRACADDFVGSLPHGVDSIIGEEGTTLSGGQRQRLAIARAVLREAPLALLDEFTAHLDPDTEHAVIASMRSYLESRTALIIAHRRPTLALADRVIALVDGRFEEVDR